jgi:DNA-binding GntR family transcriptional regulator
MSAPRSPTPRTAIAPLLHASLGERVYRTVRDLILSQVFPPGSKLNVEEICRNLGVSRTPVWDTMRRLESEGLVNTVPRHGVFVLNYGAGQIRDLFAVRGALETLAVRQAALNPDLHERASLETAMEEMERSAGADSRAAIEVHDRVLAAAYNQVLSRLLENVYAQILVLRLRSLHLPERVESSMAEHRDLFDAVMAGHADRGERLARAHADHVLQDALEFTRRAEQDP